MVDLLDIVEELENWDAGVGLILRGAENKSNIFCSGGDLKTVHEISGTALPPISEPQLVEKYSGCENGFRMSIFMSEVTNRLAALPLVSVCLLQVRKIIHNRWVDGNVSISEWTTKFYLLV